MKYQHIKVCYFLDFGTLWVGLSAACHHNLIHHLTLRLFFLSRKSHLGQGASAEMWWVWFPIPQRSLLVPQRIIISCYIVSLASSWWWWCHWFVLLCIFISNNNIIFRKPYIDNTRLHLSSGSDRESFITTILGT